MNIKKPVLGAIGLAGACAVCCTIPIAISLIAGMSAGGLASLIGWDGLMDGTLVPVGAGLVAALLVGIGLWWSRRSKATACKTEATVAATVNCGYGTSGAGCACATPPAT